MATFSQPLGDFDESTTGEESLAGDGRRFRVKGVPT
jgi:hypothetical protein